MKNYYPIRLGIFETNSSSSHSFTLGSRGRLAKTIPTDENGIIRVSTFYWQDGGDKFNDPLLKLSYLLCFAYTLFWDDDDSSRQEFCRTRLNEIADVVINFTGATGVDIKIDKNSLIDHQSIDIIFPGDLGDPEFIKEFVFNPGTYVYPLWDCYEPEDEFYEEEKIESPILYSLKFDLPGIEEDLIVPVRYDETKEEIYKDVYDLLSKYYWSGEKFYPEELENWFVPYTGKLQYSEKKVDFSIIL